MVYASAPDLVLDAWCMDAMTAKFGLQLGQSAITAGQRYVQKTSTKMSQK